MANSFNKELGLRIRAARTGKLTQSGLAEEIGLSRTAITNIECGRQRLLVDQLVDIAHALEVAVSDLLPTSRSKGASRTAMRDPAIDEMPTVARWIRAVTGVAK